MPINNSDKGGRASLPTMEALAHPRTFTFAINLETSKNGGSSSGSALVALSGW
jgi:hypothetical protein